MADPKPLAEFRGRGVTAGLEKRVEELEQKVAILEAVVDVIMNDQNEVHRALLGYFEGDKTALSLTTALRKSLLGDQ